VLAKVKTRTGRIWTYVRDDRPFGGKAPPAAVFFYSPDRASIHPEQHLAGYCGILQADAHAGFNALYEPDRKPGPIREAGCWAHARRKLFELADIASKARDRKPTTISPIAFEAVQSSTHLHAGTLDQRLVARAARGGASQRDRAAGK
jgi:transposase